MKKILAAVIGVLMLISAIIPLVTLPASAADAFDLYVSPNGSGSKDGLSAANAAPFADVKTLINQYKKGQDLVVHLSDETFVLSAPLLFASDDSADNGHTVTFLGGKNTVISGGQKITGWTKESDHVWVKNLPAVTNVNGFWMNGTRFVIASQRITATVLCQNGGNFGLVSWETEDNLPEEITNDKNLRLSYSNPQRWWKHTFQVTKATKSGKTFTLTASDETNAALLGGQNPRLSKVHTADNSSDAGFASVGARSTDYILENSKALLDHEGEYYFDYAKKKLYIYTALDPNSADCVLPQSKGLITIKGKTTSTGTKLVQGLIFKNIQFAYSTGFNIEKYPFVNCAGDYGYLGRLSGDTYVSKAGNPAQLQYSMRDMAITVSFATNIHFIDDTFTKMNAGAIHFLKFTYSSSVENCTFYNLSNAAIDVGDPDYVDDRHDNPANWETMTEIKGASAYINSFCAGLTFKNNLINYIGAEGTAAPGIGVLTGHDITITQNTFANLPSNGISVGFGNANSNAPWQSMSTGNIYLTNNVIEGCMAKLADGAAIYIASCTMGDIDAGDGKKYGCVISGNYIMSNNEPTKGIDRNCHAIGLYLDNGSDSVWMHDNFVQNCNNWFMSLDYGPYSSTNYSVQKNCRVENNYRDFDNKGVAWYDMEGAMKVAGAGNYFNNNIKVTNWQSDAKVLNIVKNAGRNPSGAIPTASQASESFYMAEKGQKAPETEAPETKAPETKAPETKAPETKAPETKAPETKAPETKAPETKAPETKAPETKAPETKAPETKAPETKAPETEAPETKPVETETVPVTDPATEPETEPETKAETQASETKAPETKAPENKDNGGLPTGAIIGIAVGAAAVVAGGVVFFVKKKKTK